MKTITIPCTFKKIKISMTQIDPEKIEQLKKMLREFKENHDVDDDGSDNFSDVDSSDMMSFNSDCSSLDSFCFSPSPKKPKLKNIRKNNSGLKDSDVQSRKSQTQNGSRIPIRKASKSVKTNEIKSTFKYAKDIQPTPPVANDFQPVNFLAPDLSAYSFLTVCFHEGMDFPRGRNGERSTYVIAKMHPDLPELVSPICFYQTKHAIYNGGFTQCCQGIDFDQTIPIIAVYDFINQDTRELIGTCPLSFQLSHVENEMCVVAKREWMTIYSTQPRVPAGKILVTILFNNDEEKARQYIQSLEAQNKSKNTNNKTSNSDLSHQTVSAFSLSETPIPQNIATATPFQGVIQNNEAAPINPIPLKVASSTQADPETIEKTASQIERDELLSNLGSLFNDKKSRFIADETDEDKYIHNYSIEKESIKDRSLQIGKSPKKHFAAENDLLESDSEPNSDSESQDDENDNINYLLSSPQIRLQPKPVTVKSKKVKPYGDGIPKPIIENINPNSLNDNESKPIPSARRQRFLKYNDFVNK